MNGKLKLYKLYVLGQIDSHQIITNALGISQSRSVVT